MPRPTVPVVPAQVPAYAPSVDAVWQMPPGVILPPRAITQAPAGFVASVAHIINASGRAFQVLAVGGAEWDEGATAGTITV